MQARATYEQQTGRERSMAPFVPFSSAVSPSTVATRDGDFIRTWRIPGLAFETAEPEEMVSRQEQLNTLYRSIGSEKVALWTHNVRRKTSDRLKARYENAFCRELDEGYSAMFDEYEMMANELYLTVIYRPNPSRFERALSKASRRSYAEIMSEQATSLRRLDEIAMQVETTLRGYGSDAERGIEVLGEYTDENGIVCSTQLEFYQFLLTGEMQKVRVPQTPLNEYLGSAWVFVGPDNYEVRGPKKRSFWQCIDFKDYTDHTEPGMLNGLMYSEYEYIMTQSFSFLNKPDGKKFLERQQTRLKTSSDGSGTQIVEIGEALDMLIQGKFAMGEYHFSLMVFGDSREAVRYNTSLAMTEIQNRGFVAAKVMTATDAAFFAQLPGNWRYRPRIAGLTSMNFAGLQSFHNFRTGKRDGNPWGEAITIIQTGSGQPLYLNFHYAKGDEDHYDRKLLGNTRVIGASGTGKTVLLNFALCQAQKYRTATDRFTNVFFDKDEGAKLTINAIGGRYLSIKNGEPTGFNPFQLEPTPANILFLERLTRTLAASNGNRVSTTDELRITQAVRAVMAMPRHMRRLSIVLQNLSEGTTRVERENSVARRLARWCFNDGTGRPGQFWWALDCPEDLLDFTTHDNYGVDGTHFLDNQDIRTPLSMYLLHRLDSVIDGRRFIYWMDEAWKWVEETDDGEAAFAEFAGNKQLTIRKQNGLGVFATQMPESLLKSKIASAMVQQVATEIYLPNPRADYREYTEGFKLSETEFLTIRGFAEDSRKFLIKQGHHSMVGVLDLDSIPDVLAILSGSSGNNELFDAVAAEVGTDPAVWLPEFHARRKARVALSKKA